MKNSVLRRPYYLLSLLALVLITVLVSIIYLYQSYSHTPVALVVGHEPIVNEPDSSEASSEAVVSDQASSKQNEQITPTMAWLSRPSHYLPGKLVDHLDDLQKRFSDGEKAAGFVLAANLLRCDRAAVTKDQMELQVEAAIENNERPGLVDQIINKFEFCQDVPSELRSKHLPYFTQLAESGFTPALEVVSSIPDKMYMQFSGQAHLPRDEYIQKRNEFKATKYRYLNQAAMQGSMLALHKLSYLNSHQLDLVEKDHTLVSLSLANVAVLLHLTENNISHSRGVFQQNRLNEIATPQELFHGQQRAMQIIKQIEDKGQAYEAMTNEKWAYTFY